MGKILEQVTIRFAGDSGDGMQLIGTEFTNTATVLGNDVGTLPDFPAEIRAPMGTLAGVSGFQIQIASYDIHTPGDVVDVLIAMNPSALKANINSLKPSGILIVNVDTFTNRGLKLAELQTNPLEDDSLKEYQVFPIPITELTRVTLKNTGLSTKAIDRCKNFFALGLIFRLYNRTLDYTINFLKNKFKNNDSLIEANINVLKAGSAYVEATEIFKHDYTVKAMQLPQGEYRNITGNEAIALGFVAAGQKSKLPVFYGSYPITPASDVLHYISKLKGYGVKTLQAEDEIAAVCSAIGASYAGNIGITGTSGPGFALKSEAINLAVMTELPLVILNVQRAGPSTGLPTKTEQSDLLQTFFGRNGESPIVILAPSRPTDCFEMAVEACRIAIKYMTPVVLLSDGYIGNGSEPWKITDLDSLRDFEINQEQKKEDFLPYKRNEKTLARDWRTPGVAGYEHRIGGIEKEKDTGKVSYDPENHDYMCRIREEKIKRIADDIESLEIIGESEGDVLFIGWGGTYGAIRSCVEQLQQKGYKVSMVHLKYINPLPKELDSLVFNFKTIIVPEINLGQLALILKSKYLIDIKMLNKINGLPFQVKDILKFAESFL